MLEQYIPVGDIPKIHQNLPRQFYWYGTDSEERFRANPGQYGAEDVTYRHNSYGYRCPEFTVEAGYKIISIGSSYTYGVGLPAEKLFHELLADYVSSQGYSVVNWNLGQGGASNDYITRTLNLAVPQLRPHLVLVNFTFPSRREYFTASGQYVNYCPTWDHMLPNSHEKQMLFNLTSDYDNMMRLFFNYTNVRNLMEATGTPWIWSTLSKDILNLAGHLDHRCYAGYFDVIDFARDGQHPGEKSHERMFLAYKEKFDDLQAIHKRRRAASYCWLG